MSHITESEADIPHNSVNQPRIHLENLFCVCDSGRWSTTVYAAESPKVLKWHTHKIFFFNVFTCKIHFLDSQDYLYMHFSLWTVMLFNKNFPWLQVQPWIHKELQWNEINNKLRYTKYFVLLFIFKNVSALQNKFLFAVILFYL